MASLRFGRFDGTESVGQAGRLTHGASSAPSLDVYQQILSTPRHFSAPHFLAAKTVPDGMCQVSVNVFYFVMEYFYLKMGARNGDVESRLTKKHPDAAVYFDNHDEQSYDAGLGKSQPRLFRERGRPENHKSSVMVVISGGRLWLLQPAGEVKFGVASEQFSGCTPKVMPVKILALIGAKTCHRFLLASATANITGDGPSLGSSIGEIVKLSIVFLRTARNLRFGNPSIGTRLTKARHSFWSASEAPRWKLWLENFSRHAGAMCLPIWEVL